MKNLLIILVFLTILSSCNNNQYFELTPEILILDKEAPVKSFEELAELLKGKPFYIDRWATWCSPCLEEFKHGKGLHSFLHDNDINIIYLNSDSDLDEKKWFDFIVEYDLKGYHVRLDSTLKSDLTHRGIFIPRIPQYIIVNEKGTVVENDALRPSDGEELHKQLKEKLNL